MQGKLGSSGMKFYIALFRMEPIQVLLVSVSLGITAYCGNLVYFYADSDWNHFATVFLYFGVGFAFFTFFGKWKEGIVISLVSIFLVQFFFRGEINEVKFLQSKAGEMLPTNHPKIGDSFFYLQGYQFSANWHYSKILTQVSHDQKGRENRHTSHFLLIPLIHHNFPNEPIRFLYVAPNAYVYNHWLNQKEFPTFARVEAITPDLRVVIKEWEHQYPEVPKGNLLPLSLYESKEEFFQSKTDFLLLLSMITPGLWFSVGFFWAIHRAFQSLIFQFRS